MDPIVGLERASLRKRAFNCKVLDYSLFFSSLPLRQQLHVMTVNILNGAQRYRTLLF